MLSSRFDGPGTDSMVQSHTLSVLALSSRFDGRQRMSRVLSVLALSSRRAIS